MNTSGIHVQNLSKTFITKSVQPGPLGFFKSRIIEEFKAVKSLSLDINEGEFVAFIGPNGAGKTTTLKMLSGILYPTSGDIDVFGFNPFDKKKEFKKMISFVMAQKTQLFMELPVKDTFDFIAQVYEVDNHEYKKKILELGDIFKISSLFHRKARKLSLGQRMKCELICALIYNPKIIFLDEPTIGLDVNSSFEVRSFLKDLNTKFKTTILLTTHNMDDVEELCERSIVINHGEKIFDGTTKQLKDIFGDERTIEFLLEGNEIKTVTCPKSKTTQVITEMMNAHTVLEINFKDNELSHAISKIYAQ